MHDYREPSFPLSTEQFRHALNAGLGRARMHLDRYDLSSELRQAVLASAVTCPVYDPQVEGLPAEWFVDFCIAADIASELMLREPGGGHWDQAWRFALLAQFVRRGLPGARAALYDCLVATEKGDLLGAEDLVEVEGVAGLLYVARHLGAMWKVRAPVDPDDGPLIEFDQTQSKGAALALLTTAASSDSDINTYLQVLSARHPRAPSLPRRRPSPSEMLDTIASSAVVRPGLGYQVREYTEDEIAPIRRLASSTSNDLVLENCLRAMSGCKRLPFDEGLVAFLSHRAEMVRYFAARTIGNHREPDVIAEVGRRYLSNDPLVALTILRRSARASDLDQILESLTPPPEATAHDVALAVLNMLDESSLPPDPRMWLFVYEVTPCQTCRYLAVKGLSEVKSCPSWLLEEALFDANRDIRELASASPITT